MQAAGDLLVDARLLVLGGQAAAGQVEVLGAEEADAVGAVLQDGVDIARRLDVGGEQHAVAVGGFGRLEAEGGEAGADVPPGLLDLPVALEGEGRGMQDEDALVAVDEDGVAGLHPGAHVVQAHHGGDLQRAGHDGGVRGGAAEVGREAEDAVLAERGGLGGGEVVGDQHARLAQLLQVHGGVADQVAQDAAGDVLHVGCALAQVVVLHPHQGLGIAVGHEAQHGLDVLAQVVKLAHDLLDEGAVVHHQQVGVEDAGILLADGRADLALDLVDLAPGGDERILEAGDLAGNVRLGEVALHRAVVLGLEHEDPSDGDAGGDPDALQGEVLLRSAAGLRHGVNPRRISFRSDPGWPGGPPRHPARSR